MDLELPLWFEIGSLVVLSLILLGDLLLILKRPHIPSTRESTLWVVFYVTLKAGIGGQEIIGLGASNVALGLTLGGAFLFIGPTGVVAKIRASNRPVNREAGA